MGMYDCGLGQLMAERKLARFSLDNGCLYAKHFRNAFPDVPLEIMVPMFHALGHGYVRAAPPLCACMRSIR